MNAFVKIACSLLIVCLLSIPAAAQQLAGKIIDIFGDNITTVQLEGQHTLAVGNTVELTYMAGVIPMLIGQYQVTSVQQQIFLAKPISLQMPPNNGMKVQVHVKEKNNWQQPSQQQVSTPAPKAPAPSPQPTAAPKPTGPIEGKVVEVIDSDVKISISGGVSPVTGQAVELFYVTGQGRKLPVGSWQVQSVDGKTVTASKVKGLGNARIGLLAVIGGEKKTPQQTTLKTSNVSPGPQGAGQVQDLFSNSGSGVFGSSSDPKKRGLSFDDYVDKKQPKKEKDLFADFFKDAPGTKMMQKNPGQWKEVTFEGYKKELLAQSKNYSFDNKKQSRLGVALKNNDSLAGQIFARGPMGIRVIAIEPGSPAEQAGIEIADIIYEADSRPVDDLITFANYVKSTPSKTLRLKLQRNFKLIEKSVPLRGDPLKGYDPAEIEKLRKELINK